MLKLPRPVTPVLGRRARCGPRPAGRRGGKCCRGPLHVLASTTLLASLASDVARGRADVSSLMPVGASPETYQPARRHRPGSRRRADHRKRRRPRSLARPDAALGIDARADRELQRRPHRDRSEPASVARSGIRASLRNRDARRHDRRRSRGAAIYRANAAALDGPARRADGAHSQSTRDDSAGESQHDRVS